MGHFKLTLMSWYIHVHVPTEARKKILEAEADLNFVIPERQMYYTFKKWENMKWPLITSIFWAKIGYVWACISITDHTRPVKVIYCFRPHNAQSLNISFIYIILQQIIYWSVTQYPIKSATLACSSPFGSLGFDRVAVYSILCNSWLSHFKTF